LSVFGAQASARDLSIRAVVVRKVTSVYLDRSDRAASATATPPTLKSCEQTDKKADGKPTRDSSRREV